MIDLKRGLIDVDIDGIDPNDYPDFVDAFIVTAYWKDTGEELTLEELDEINTNHRDIVYHYVIKKLF